MLVLDDLSPEDLDRVRDIFGRYFENVRRVIRGKDDCILLATIGLLCGGHVLAEDVPGTGKTMLAKTIAKTIRGVSAYRIQCTPDLRPSDISGIEIFNQKKKDFEMRKGPILLADIVVADEINRMQPKSQSALLEAMEEKQTTIGTTTYRLSPLFFVIATQNPLEHQGTYPLPEAQRDRFLLQLEMGYPTLEDEVEIVLAQQGGHPIEELSPTVELEEVLWLKEAVCRVHIDRTLVEWTVRLVHETRDVRKHGEVIIGASVRGSEDLTQAARARALLDGRVAVIPEDIVSLLPAVLGHRIFFRGVFLARMRAEGRRAVLEEFFRDCIREAPLSAYAA